VANPQQANTLDGDALGDACDAETLRGGGSRCASAAPASAAFGLLLAVGLLVNRRRQNSQISF